MMKLIPARVANPFSRVSTPPTDLPEYPPAGWIPALGANPARPKPAKGFSLARMAPVVVGLGLLVGPGQATATQPLGIDVSSYQGGSINWSSVKSGGYTFAWAKATEGTYYIDADFTINEANAKAAGVYIGAYHFARPDLNTGTSGADTEATYFWNEAKNYLTGGNGYLVPMLDFETSSGTGAEMSAWINEWCQDVKNLAAANGAVCNPVVYTTGSIASSLSSPATDWPLDIADPGYTDPQGDNPSVSLGPWGTWTFWQYSWTGSVPGVSGSVDEDIIDGTASTLQLFLITTSGTTAGAGVELDWDPGAKKASPGSGGTGTWNTGTANWWLSGTGDVAWNAGGDYANFAGTAATVTLGANVTADSITFNTAGYVISGSDTLTLNSPGNISVAPGSPTYIECVLGGVGYNLSGGGILVLNNADNGSGSGTSAEFIVGPGTTLVVNNDHAVGNSGVTLNLENGGIYQNNDTTSGDQFLLPGSAIALLSGGGVFDNPNASLIMTNWITGPGSLTIDGTTAYYLELTDTANNYTGGTIVINGTTLQASGDGALGAASGSVTLTSGTLKNNGAALSLSSSRGIILNGTSSYIDAGWSDAITINGPVSGSGALQINEDSGSVVLVNTGNSYTGDTVIGTAGPGYYSPANNALLQLGANNVIPSGSGYGNVSINQTYYGQLDVHGHTQTINGLSGNGTVNNTTGSGSLSVGANDQTSTFSGVIENTGGTLTLTKVGAGTLTLSGANTYTGITTLSAGEVIISADDNLGAAPSSAVANQLTFNSNTALRITASFALSAKRGVTLGSGGGNFQISSGNTVTNLSVITGSGGLEMGTNPTTGEGTLVLSAANTYTGATTITCGTLRLAASGALPDTSVFIAAAAVGGTLDLNGYSPTIATLSAPLGTNATGNVINNTGTLTINGTVGSAGTGESGSSAYPGAISGSGNVAVTGGGSHTLSGANTYGGTTTVSGGTLVPSLSGALPSASALTVNSPGIFDIVSVNEMIPSLAGSGSVNLGSGTLTVNGSTSTTFSGVIQDAPGEVYVANSTSQPGLWGYYYNANNPGFAGTPVMRLDTNVDFTDLTTQQPSGIDSTEFTVRWVGRLLTTSSGGTYTFWTTSDDGSRLWVNGQLVVNNWAYQPATAVTNTISLSANTYYDIRLEYEQGVGGASCVLSWMPPGGTSAVIPSSNLSTYAGYGGLVKSGTSTLNLSGANTYQGGTTVSGGTLYGSVSGSIPGNVTISAGTLELGSASAMSSSATLTLATTPAAGAVNLNFSGTQTISALYFGATSMATGTWGATGTSAAHQNAAFTGTGLLNVTSGGTSQSISFSNPGTQTYGVAPISLGATAPGGTVTYTVTSGPATIAGSILTITGAGSVTVQANQAGNNTYDAASPVPQTFTVNPKVLNYTGVSAANKVYDGMTTASLSGTAATLTPESPGTGSTSDGKPYIGDTVSFTTGTLTGTLASSGVGNGIAVTVTGGVTLTAGGQSTNYSLGSPNPALTANITQKPLTAQGNLSISSKVYDGTTIATPSGAAALPGTEPAGSGSVTDGRPYSVDSVSLTGTASYAYNSKDVATATTVTESGLSLTGAGYANYTLTAPTLSAGITAKPLNYTGISATNTVYSATNTASLYGTAATLAAESPGTGSAIDGAPYTGDTVSFTTGTLTGAFASQNVETNIAVTVTGGLALTGAQSGDYSVGSPNPALAANITAKPLTVTGLSVSASKAYDGTTATATPSGTPTLLTAEAPGSGTGADGAPYIGDTVPINGPATGSYNDPTVAGANTVTFSGLSTTNDNYSIAEPTQAATITPLTTSCSLGSSVNPSALGSNVTFTASVNGVPPAADLPTGNVVFSANGAPFATNALVSGGISASTASLPSGTNTLTAQYLGDGNFLGSTGNVAQVVQAPVASGPTNTILSIVDNSDGTFTLTFVGTPQTQYYVVAGSDLTTPLSSWVPLAGSTNTVTNTDGLWSYTVTNTDPQQFYRSAAVVPGP